MKREERAADFLTAGGSRKDTDERRKVNENISLW
jgi:hypothetical protein